MRTSVSWLLAALGRRISSASGATARLWNESHLGPARPQPRHPRALYHFGASPQGSVQRGEASALRFRREPRRTITATACDNDSSSPTRWAIRRSTAATQPQNEQRELPEDEEVALHVVEETDDGVIVTGGKQLSTAASAQPTSATSRSRRRSRMRNDPRCVLAFAIPTDVARAQDPGARAGVALVRLAGAIRCRCSTSRTACCSSTACSCRGTGCSCSTIRRRW